MLTFQRMNEIRKMTEDGTLDRENINTEEAKFALNYLKAGLERKTINANNYNAWSVYRLQKIVEVIDKKDRILQN